MALNVRDALVGRGSTVVGAPLRNLVSMPGEVKCPTQGVDV